MIAKLKPAFKDYLWGGERLRSHYNKDTEMMPLAESWELSCHPDGESLLISGAYEGLTLSEYVRKHPQVLGTKATSFDRFPILVKLIDAKLSLSVQVHPDDTYGMRVENEPGKTEVWYVLDAEADAKLIMGFNRKTSKEEVKKAVEDGELMGLLHQVPVKTGDVFFIESGTVHGIGAGITLIEIQQNSNTTYRVYDYDRVGKDGKKRPLHLEKALEVMTYEPARRILHEPPLIASCDYFHVEAYEIDGQKKLWCSEASFQSLTCVEGALAISLDGTEIELKKGESAFVSAGAGDYQVTGKGKLILSSI